MKIAFCGMELTAKSRALLTEEQERKRIWTLEKLEPFLKSIDGDITDVWYFDTEEGLEVILINYESGDSRVINVSADSVRGIAYDVIKRVC